MDSTIVLDAFYSCGSCGRPLTETDFNTTHRVRLCNHFDCRLYGRPQATRELSEEESKAFSKRRLMRTVRRFTDGNGKRESVTPDRHEANARAKARPGYRPWLERKKANYHKLRDLGYSCKDAIVNSSKKRMIELGVTID